MNTPDSPKEENVPAPKKRNRSSKLDGIYYHLARLLMDNAKLKLAKKKALSLDRIADHIAQKHGVFCNKSTLSRYLKKHWALKLL